MNIDFPFTSTGAAAPPRPTDDDHVRDMIEQLLFTTRASG